MLGNILSKVDVGTYNYNHPAGGPKPLHAPRSILNGGVTRTFYYDPSGNEKMRTDGPEGTRTTEYTSFNLPISIKDTLPQQSTTTFEYDGDNARVIKVENDVRQTVYAGNLYERVTDASGGSPVVTHKYRIFAQGKQIAQLERTQGATDNLVYLHGDHLGSTQLITKGTPDQSSNLRLFEQTFDPWGQPEGTAAWDDAAHPNVRNVRTGFTGHEHDPVHRLINMRGRIYDPELGRFTTPDPIVQAPFYSQSFNRYAYVFNNPFKYTDPSGFTVINPQNPVPPDTGGGPDRGPPNPGPPGPPAKPESPSEGEGVPKESAIGADSPGGPASGPKDEGPGGGGEAPDAGPGGGDELPGFGEPNRPGAGDAAQRDGNATWAGSGDPRGGTREGGPQRGGSSLQAKEPSGQWSPQPKSRFPGEACMAEDCTTVFPIPIPGGSELAAGGAAVVQALETAVAWVKGLFGVGATVGETVAANVVTAQGMLRTSATVAQQLAAQRGFIPVQAIVGAIASGVRTVDPQGVANQFMYTAQAAYNQSQGILQVLVNEKTNTIVHVLFRSQ
jgi:RHS repeat-associated protein